MKEKSDIAIIGGGAVAQTFAADLTLAGYKVRLYELPEYAPKSLGEVLKTHEIELGGLQLNFKWFRRAGIAKIDTVTTDMSEALKGVSLIIVALPSIAHEVFFEKMIPYLEDGQVISIFPDNFSSLILKKMMRQQGCKAKVVIGGWSSAPYGTRKMEPGKLDCILRTRRLMYDAFPSADREKFFEAVKDLPVFDGTSTIEEGDTVIGVDFSNPNPVVHVPGSILSVGPMEVSQTQELIDINIPKGKFSMYKYGLSPSVSRVQFAYYQEISKIANAMGIKMVEYTEDQFFSKGSVMGIEFSAPFSDVILPPIVGPNSTEDRYFTEDIPVGTVVYYSFAKKLGVDVPIIESMIRLGSVICKRDFLKEGRTLEKMGLDGLSGKQIVKYVREGNI
jgi:opine dehydrogenase